MIKNRIQKKLKIILTVSILILLFTGCEDVIHVDLNSVEPRLVIEAYILDNPGLAIVALSQSIDYYNPGDFSLIPAQLVTISDSQGNVDTLSCLEMGYYASPFSNLIVNETYTALVIVDDITYSASATMPEPIVIDSISTEYQEGGGFGSLEDEGYRFHVFFTDIENTDDYCRLKITQNDFSLGNYFLYDGRYSDGNSIDYEYFYEVFQLDDTLIVDLFTMDNVVFDYLKTLQLIIANDDGGNGSAAPANPNTNWSNDALGYFGVFSVRSDTIIVENDNSSP